MITFGSSGECITTGSAPTSNDLDGVWRRSEKFGSATRAKLPPLESVVNDLKQHFGENFEQMAANVGTHFQGAFESISQRDQSSEETKLRLAEAIRRGFGR